jgi:hypothetical protein
VSKFLSLRAFTLSNPVPLFSASSHVPYAT